MVETSEVWFRKRGWPAVLLAGWLLAPVPLVLAAVPSSPAGAVPVSPAPPAGADIRGIVPPQPFYLAAGGLWLVLAGVCLVLAGVLAWIWWRQRPKKLPGGPALTPFQIATRRLQQLETRLPETDPRAFGEEVADVLRVYIGQHYGLQPERQTTEEFLASIRGSRVFTASEHGLLTTFLDGCDLLKFARADATLDGKRRLLAQAVDFLESSARPPVVPLTPQPPPLPTAAPST